MDHPLCVRPGGFGISPYMQDLSCHMGQEEVYERAEELLGKYLRVEISSKQLERLCNSYGEVISERLYAERLDQGRSSAVYVMLDGSMILTREAGWKEVKLGRIFEKTDLMALHTTRNWVHQSEYVAEISGLKPFLNRMESVIPTQSQLVFVADGARWIWNWVESLYPQSVQILDFYHAVEHAAAFAALAVWYTDPKK